jgi:hypothetical protein
VVFSRSRNNDLPWSREHLYRRQSGKVEAGKPELVDG